MLSTMFTSFNTTKSSAIQALPSSNSAPTKLLNFCGNDNEDVTIFLRDVKRLAHTQGRQDDDKWLVDYVELCLAGEALRWFSELDDEVVRLWKSLRRAFLQRFKPPTAPLEPPAAVPPTVKSRPASIVPFPAEPSDLVPPNSPKPAPILVKLVVIGDTAVGKTDLVTRYCTGTWVKPGTATVGIDFKIKTIQVGGAPVKLQIWDTAGAERFRHIITSYFNSAMGILMVYDVTSHSSFINTATWASDIDHHASRGVVKILVGNKCDWSERRIVTREQGVHKAQGLGMHFVETSGKTGENVEEVFAFLAATIINKTIDV